MGGGGHMGGGHMGGGHYGGGHMGGAHYGGHMGGAHYGGHMGGYGGGAVHHGGSYGGGAIHHGGSFGGGAVHHGGSFNGGAIHHGGNFGGAAVHHNAGGSFGGHHAVGGGSFGNHARPNIGAIQGNHFHQGSMVHHGGNFNGANAGMAARPHIGGAMGNVGHQHVNNGIGFANHQTFSHNGFPGMHHGNVGTNHFNGGFTGQHHNLSNNPGLRSNLLHSRLASNTGYHHAVWNGHGNWNNNNWGHHHHGWGGYGGYGGWGRYGNWYRGSWGGGYYGNSFWNPWYGGYGGYWGRGWGLGFWGLNSLAYGFGYYGYSNPYYLGGYGGYGGYASPVYSYCNYNQPLISYTTNASAQSATDGAEAQSMALFDQARSSFQQGNYQDALNQIDKALAGMPKDAEMNEFRGLALFALGRYTESAEVLYSVLSVGPGWDWPTMIGLYPSVDAYTKQLRALEAYCRSNPDNAAAHFVLGYQYTTCGHKETAIREFNKVMKLMPNDKVSAAMIKMLGGTPDAQAAPTTPPAAAQPGVNATPTAPATPEAAPVAPPEKKDIPADQLISKDALVGTWSATGSDGTKFTLNMAANGSFTWTFTREGNSQEAKGVFAIDKNVLALEPDNDAGSMLGELTKKSDNEFHFSLIGAPAGDPGLDFKK